MELPLLEIACVVAQAGGGVVAQAGRGVVAQVSANTEVATNQLRIAINKRTVIFFMFIVILKYKITK
jgi:hypothetical protein